MKVDIGAGARRSGRGIALDIAGEPDVRADVLALPFRDGSITELSAIDVLEHLSYRDTDRALAEWARVCRRGATFYVQVPDADTLMHWYVNNPELLGTPPGDVDPMPLGVLTWKLLGGHADGRYADAATWRYNAHYALFSTDSLRAALALAGFEVEALRVNAHPNILCWARRL